MHLIIMKSVGKVMCSFRQKVKTLAGTNSLVTDSLIFIFLQTVFVGEWGVLFSPLSVWSPIMFWFLRGLGGGGGGGGLGGGSNNKHCLLTFFDIFTLNIWKDRPHQTV